MSIESDAASQVVGIYTAGIKECGEVAIKIGGELFKIPLDLLKYLAKNATKFTVSKLYEEGVRGGQVKINNLLRESSKENFGVSLMSIKKEDDFKILQTELTSHGVKFCVVPQQNGAYDFMFSEKYASIINSIIENNNINSVEKVEDYDVNVAEEQPEQKSVYEEMFTGKPDEEILNDEDIIEVDNVEDFVNHYEAQMGNNSVVDLSKENDEYTFDFEDPFAATFEPNSTPTKAEVEFYRTTIPINTENSQEYESADEFSKSMFGDSQKSDNKTARGEKAAVPTQTPKREAPFGEKSSTTSRESLRSKIKGIKERQSKELTADIVKAVEKTASAVGQTANAAKSSGAMSK